MTSSNQSVARDVFMYLLVIVVLGMSTISFGALLFDLINHYLPDATRQICAFDGCASSIRSELAFLIVAFPILVWAWRFLQRDLAAHPEKEDMKIRKWLLYLTLFVVGITVIGDLVVLIRGWLGGELTLQFALKVSAVFYIAGSVFYYFLRKLHPEKRGREGLVAKITIVAVIVAVAAGLWTAGSPASARDRSQDAQRVSDLSSIQYQVVSVFWTAKQRLPESLEELEDPISGFRVPVDPKPEEAYEYFRTGIRDFVLCATFSTETSSTNAAPLYRTPLQGTGNWDHGVGRECFTRTVDPELYPPKVR